jgi:hypothetical protein
MWHRAPTGQDHVDPFALAGDNGVERVELTVDGGGVATVADGGDESCSGGNYMAHGGLWFCHTVEVVLRYFHRCHYRSSPLWFFYWWGLWSLGRKLWMNAVYTKIYVVQAARA